MKRSPLISVCVRYGLVAGLLALILLVAMYYIGRHPLMISPFLDFRILLFGVFIFFSLKELRDYYQGGALYFWQGILGGLLLVLVASTVASAGLIGFGSLEPALVSSYIDHMTQYLKTFSNEDIERIGKEIYDRNLSHLPATNITKLAMTYFVQGLAIGFFISIILSVIVRRHPKT